MKRWFWFFVAFFISTSVYFTIRYGLRPKAIPVMGASEFAAAEQIGVEVYRRLRQSVRAERLVLLGSSRSAAEDDKVWAGFMQAAVADGEKLVYLESAGAEESLVRERLKAGLLVVIHSRTKDVSHFVEGSLSHRLENIVQHPVLSISTLPFAINPTEQDDIHIQCLEVGAGSQADGENRLRCASQRIARRYQRRALDPSKLWAVIERDGLKEYLVFIHP